MLSIAKLRVGQEAYHLSGVAQSLDDYYTGAGEAQGQWLGGGAARLDLVGQVGGDDLRAVLAGLRPGTGGLTPNGDTLRPHPRRVPGFDLTFKAPKSASVLYAVSDDPRVQGAVIDAGEAAMRAAISWLEREAAQVQRGSHNVAYLARLGDWDRQQAGPKRLRTSGVVAAAFRHRTSRAGDPLLHWHVLVANLAEGTDDRWSSLVHPEIYQHARAAGEIFQTVYRDELTRSIGVEWRPGRHVPEIAGIPQHLLDLFSKRSTEVDAWLEATGTANTPEGRHIAVLATRRNKPEQEQERLDAAWKHEAEQYGWGPLMADGLVAAATRRAGTDYESAWRLETIGADENGGTESYERTVTPDEWIEHVLRRHLTNDRSTFTLADVTQAVAHQLGDGASIDTIERITRRVIGSPHVVAVHNSEGPGAWTSRELVEVEQRFIGTLGVRHAAAPAAETAVSAIADRPTLGDDQRLAIETICASNAAVSVLVGQAGTGKTFTLDAIRAAFEAAGVPVRGAAPSARAALELDAATGMPATTLHRLLVDQQSTFGRYEQAGLLVVDEAGMADIRTLTQAVTAHVAAGGQVLLAGDHHQLPEIGAGGGFAYAARHAGTVAELTVNRRQRHSWERAALSDLRDGNVADAVHAYVDHDRLTVAATPGDLVENAIRLWADARTAGHQPVLLAGTNELVDRLNQAAITHLIDTGELNDTDQQAYGRTPLRAGERVVLRRNSAAERDAAGDIANVANGHAGVVIAVDQHQATVALDHGPTVQLDDQYLRRGGHLTHAYALTSHRAQGGTWDLAIAVGADTLYREAAYVQLSRGVHANHIVLTDPEATELLASAGRDTARHDHGITHPDDEPDAAEDHLITRISRSAAKSLAHTVGPDPTVIDRLAISIPLDKLEAHARHAAYAEHVATTTHGHSHRHLAGTLARVIDIAQRIAVGQQMSPADRHNVGTVTDIDDNAGTATLLFTSRSGHEAVRTFLWGDLRYVEASPPPQRHLSETARSTIDEITSGLETAMSTWTSTIQSMGVQPHDFRRYSYAAQRAVDHAASRLAADRPDWIHRHLGQRPTDVAGARTWDGGVAAIARWQLTHDQTTLPDPASAHQLRTWLSQTRAWLDDPDRSTPAVALVRTAAELDARRSELEQILDSAPADCRHIIDQLQSGQLTLGDTDELLHVALDQQDARRQWILEHWPHIVEYAELDRMGASAATLSADALPDHLPMASR